MRFNIKLLYLYLFSSIGLLISTIGAVQIVDLAIKIYIFKGADKYEIYSIPVTINPGGKEIGLTESEIAEQKRIQNIENSRQRQRQASTALALLVVGVPLYKYHWNQIKTSAKK